MAVEYNFTLDMDRSKRDNNIAYARTGDLDSIVINADLVFNGAAYTPTGANAFFECVAPNGCSVRAAAEKTGSSVSVEVPSAAFQAAGVINVAYFRFETGDTASPSYVESTEPFAIVVREGIGDNIDTGDYIEGWRLLADQIEALKDDVEQKAEQAKTAISEQKEEVDELKSQAQIEIAGDVTTIESAKTQAISDINGYKADVANAAEGITEAGEQAISQFNTNSQQAINSFNTKGESAVGQFNTNGTSAINQFNTNADDKLDEVDGMITEAQGDVNAAITQLETATSQAVDAMEDALEGTTAGSLQNAINRALKLDIADMTNIPDNASLSSFTNVGSYCCKTASTAATIGDSPIDDGPFNMYVFSSATSGQVMQLAVPIDLQGKPTAEWHVRFGTSSAMDPWSVIGGAADIAAGLGIDVAGDAQKTVSLDTTAFYEHVGPSNIVSGSTEVTGGGRFKEVRIKGRTVKNLYKIADGGYNGVKVSTNETGLMTVSGTATADLYFVSKIDVVPNVSMAYYVSEAPSNVILICEFYDSGAKYISSFTANSVATVPQNAAKLNFGVYVKSGATVNASFRAMLVEGTEAPDCFTPAGIHGVEIKKMVVAGKNLLQLKPGLAQSTINGVTFTPQEDGGILVNGTATNTAFYDIDFAYTNTVVTTTANNTKPNLNGQTVTAYLVGATNAELFIGAFKDFDRPTGYYSIVNSVGVATAKIPEDALALRSFLCVAAGKTVDNEIVYPQLELGSTATAYEPPNVTTTLLPEVELHGLPNGMCDELVINADGTCEVERKTVKDTFDGSEDEHWSLNVADNGHGIANFKIDGTSYSTSGVSAICNTLPIDTSLQSNATSAGILIADGSLYIRLPSTTADTVEELRTWLKANPTTVVSTNSFTGSIEPQSPVTIPVLPTPSFNVYSTGGYVPSEIESDVVKVDCLPALNAYTREEVDQKIEAAGGMPDIVPVSQGGTGVTTAAAERNRLGLGNTTGALPVANGGTGKTAAKAAQNALLADLNAVSNDATDETIFVGYYGSPSDANGAIYKRAATTVWNWIASKIRSIFGFNSSNVLDVEHGGTGFNDFPAMIVDLGSMSSASLYQSAPRPGVMGTLPVSHGGTGSTSASSARTNLDVYSKSEVDGKIPKVVVGSGNIPGDAEEGTIYINYQ